MSRGAVVARPAAQRTESAAMRQSVQQSFNLEGLDPDVRDAAREAARRAGMSLDEWLSVTIADRAARAYSGETPRRRAASPSGGAYEDLDSVASRLGRVTRNPRAAAAAAPSGGGQPRSIDQVIAALTAEQDRRARESASKTAEALDSVARWIERAEDRMSETTRTVAERQDRTANVLGEALGLMTRRLDDIERKVAEGNPASVSAALKAVEKLEQHIARAEAERRAAGDIAKESETRLDARLAEALAGFESRIAAIGERMAPAPSNPAPSVPGRPLGRRGLSVRDELVGAVAEIRSRQAELEAPGLARRAEEPAGARTHSDVLGSLRADIAKLAGQLDTLKPRGEAPAAESVRAEIAMLRDRVSALATREEIGALEGVLRDLAREASQSLLQAKLGVGAPDAGAIGATLSRLESEMRRLSDEVARVSPHTLVGVVEELSHKIDLVADAGVEPRIVQGLADQLADLRALLAEIAEPSRVDGLAEQVAELTAQVARIARAQIDPIDFAGVRSAVEEIRGSTARREAEEAAAREAVAARESALAALVDRIEGLGEKLDSIAGMVSGSDLGALARQIETLSRSAARVETGASVDLSPLAGQIETLGARIDALAAREPDAPDLSPVAREIAALEARLSESLSGSLSERLSEGLSARLSASLAAPSGSVAPAALVARLDVLAEKLDAMREAPPASHGLDIEGLMRRLDRIDQSLARPRDRSEFEPLEQMLGKLAEKIDRAGNEDGLEALERQIGEIAARLDREAAPDPALASLERSMSALMAQVEGLKDELREPAARAEDDDEDDAALALIERSLGELRAAQSDADRKSRDTLSAVHTTLEALVGRLAGLEQAPRVDGAKDARRPRPKSGAAPADRGEPEAASARDLDPIERLARRTQAIAAGEPMAAAPASRAPRREGADDPLASLDDILLEPGSGRPDGGRGPAAASDLARPRNLGEEAEPGDIKASFIAAARRAAQSAAAEAAAAARSEPEKAIETGRAAPASLAQRMRGLIERRRKPLLMGLAAIVLALGALQIGRAVVTAPEAPAEMAEPVRAPVEERLAAPAPEIAAPVPATEPSVTASGRAPDPGADPEEDLFVPETTEALPEPGPRAPTFAMGGVAGPAAVIPADDLVRSGPGGMSGMVLPPRRDGLAAVIGGTPTIVAGVEVPASVGTQRLREAARDGDRIALYVLAEQLSAGRALPRAAETAARLFERAAEAGLVPAQYRIGQIHDKGIGVARDPQSAEIWYRRAAESGNVTAMHNLAVLLAEGVAGTPDYTGAIGWFRRAAEHGVRDSQYNLAVLLARGLGTPQDLVASYTWFAIAAAGGDSDAAARKEEVGLRLAEADRLAADAAAGVWRPETPDPAANEVAIPAEGWNDRSAGISLRASFA